MTSVESMQNEPADRSARHRLSAQQVVAHWINFQHYASTVDNARYGCGNKVLRNIVGGHLGVFEGNATIFGSACRSSRCTTASGGCTRHPGSACSSRRLELELAVTLF